jgi:uncharacterized protein (TIGR02147 family)
LSQVLNKKKKLGAETAVAISSKLKFKGVRRKVFLDLVRLDLAKSVASRALIQKEVDSTLKRHPGFKCLPEDVFNLVSDWHHFAILELAALPGFSVDPKWIAPKLRITQAAARAAIERLKSAGLLIEVNGGYRKFEKNYIFENVPSAAIRKHHRDTLDLAKRALQEQPMDVREFFTVCFPMNVTLIPDVKRKIREFSESLMAEMQDERPQAVYKLAVQFFRLDQETL